MPSPLLSDIANGDASAVHAFLKRYSSAVWSVARRYCASAEDAEDATQEIFVEVWKCADRFNERSGSELTFLMTIARRRLIDRVRRQRRRPQATSLEEPDAIPSPDADRTELDDEVNLAREALQKLKPEQQQVLGMALGEGRTHQEISAAIGIPLGTVKSHARRGLLRLREMLGVTDPETDR